MKVIDPKSAPKDDSGQVRFKLAQWFQRRRFLKKFTDRRQTPSDGNSSHRWVKKAHFVKEHPRNIQAKFAVKWFQKRIIINKFPIWSYAKTLSYDGSHLAVGFQINKKRVFMKQFRFGKDFSNLTQSETIIGPSNKVEFLKITKIK